MITQDKNKISSIMKHIIWDYDIEPYHLYEVITGMREKIGAFDKNRVLVRMIERLSWYDLINILGYDFLKNNITSIIIKQIRFEGIRDKYEFIRKILQGETISFSGWSPEYREKIKHTLLSHRRHGP